MMSYMSEDDAEFKQIAAGELAAQDSVVLKAYAEASLQLAENMTVASQNTESCQQLLAGEAAMTINVRWSLTTLKDYDPDVQIALISLPHPLGESKVAISIDPSFCVSSSTKHPDECLTFLDFLSQPEFAQLFTDIEGSPNVVTGVAQNVPELAVINEGPATARSASARTPSGPAASARLWAAWPPT